MRIAYVLVGILLTVLSANGRLLAQDSDTRLGELFRRNIGSREQMYERFPPHRIVGNVYYVGTTSLASFLVTTPDGHILINSNFEANVPLIRESVEELGFRFEDIAIVLGSHGHGDHMEGDALVKQLTGAEVMAIREEVPLLERLEPGGKPHPIDRILEDREEITLGGTTLVVHLTPGHTPGCMSWALQAEEDGETYDVVIIGSVGMNPGYQLVNNPDRPTIVEEYRRAYERLRSLPVDVPLGSHPSMYRMAEKYPLIDSGPNPFIDPEGYIEELDLNESIFRLRLEEQGAETDAN
jgi:metallo-beta-lactamase class B